MIVRLFGLGLAGSLVCFFFFPCALTHGSRRQKIEQVNFLSTEPHTAVRHFSLHTNMNINIGKYNRPLLHYKSRYITHTNHSFIHYQSNNNKPRTNKCTLQESCCCSSPKFQPYRVFQQRIKKTDELDGGVRWENKHKSESSHQMLLWHLAKNSCQAHSSYMPSPICKPEVLVQIYVHHGWKYSLSYYSILFNRW